MKKIRIFREIELSGFLSGRSQQMEFAVSAKSADDLMNVNEQDYVNYLESEFRIDPLMIDFQKKTADYKEKMIPAKEFPEGFFRPRRGESYKKQVITLYIPFSGDAELLRCRPSHSILWTHDIDLREGNICFDVTDFWGDGERVKKDIDDIVSSIERQAVNVVSEVDNFNKNFKAHIVKVVEFRKSQLTDRDKVRKTIGIPIRKSENVPETFAVPVSRKDVIVEPTAPDTAKPAVPTLNEGIYNEILKIIHDMGKMFERLPNTYADKTEEMLRDHFIMMLEPHFRYASTTGETFNKTGKTDILIRHEGNNVFVAECKFWEGKAQHEKTIDQLLDYLTWRDSKTAIIYFVKRKQIIPILKEIPADTKAHRCFRRELEKKDDSWQVYELHLPNDPDCPIKVAVLAFHIPEP